MKKEFENRIEYYNDLGRFHRLDGPAVVYNNGTKEWFINGQFHRLDGPAVECSSGFKAWWINNQRHRLDGPAVEWSNGAKEWWVNGECFSQKDFEQHPLVLQEKQRKQDLELIKRIRNNKKVVSRWRLL